MEITLVSIKYSVKAPETVIIGLSERQKRIIKREINRIDLVEAELKQKIEQFNRVLAHISEFK